MQGLPKHVRGLQAQKAPAQQVFCWPPGRTALRHSLVTLRLPPRAFSQGCYLLRLLQLQQRFQVVFCQTASRRQST